jgi:hypothetical protein
LNELNPEQEDNMNDMAARKVILGTISGLDDPGFLLAVVVLPLLYFGFCYVLTRLVLGDAPSVAEPPGVPSEIPVANDRKGELSRRNIAVETKEKVGRHAGGVDVEEQASRHGKGAFPA